MHLAKWRTGDSRWRCAEGFSTILPERLFGRQRHSISGGFQNGRLWLSDNRKTEALCHSGAGGQHVQPGRRAAARKRGHAAGSSPGSILAARSACRARAAGVGRVDGDRSIRSAGRLCQRRASVAGARTERRNELAVRAALGPFSTLGPAVNHRSHCTDAAGGRRWTGGRTLGIPARCQRTTR